MDSATSSTLLNRMREAAGPMAWREFFDRYWRAMYAFALRQRCSEHTAEDVVQDAMLAVYRNIGVFHYDRSRGRFKNWLLTLVQQKIALRRRREAGKEAAFGGNENPLVRREPMANGVSPEAAWEAVCENALLLALLDVIRREVRPETYQAFELTALHELPVSEAADLTGLSPNAVSQARRRVLDRLGELGAPYARSGRLRQRVKEAMSLCENPRAERTLTRRVETTMQSTRG